MAFQFEVSEHRDCFPTQVHKLYVPYAQITKRIRTQVRASCPTGRGGSGAALMTGKRGHAGGKRKDKKAISERCIIRYLQMLWTSFTSIPLSLD